MRSTWKTAHVHIIMYLITTNKWYHDYTGRSNGHPPPPGSLPHPEKSLENVYPPLLPPGLPPHFPCSPRDGNQSPHSMRSSPSPRDLSPGIPDDLSMAKNNPTVPENSQIPRPTPMERFETNKINEVGNWED